MHHYMRTLFDNLQERDKVSFTRVAASARDRLAGVDFLGRFAEEPTRNSRESITDIFLDVGEYMPSPCSSTPSRFRSQSSQQSKPRPEST